MLREIISFHLIKSMLYIFRILVGAPRDNVTLSKADPIVRQTVRPGAIHQCPFSSSTSDCDQLDLMTSGKSNQIPVTNIFTNIFFTHNIKFTSTLS